MTARTRSWPVTTARRWREGFWTSPAVAFRRRRNEGTDDDRGNRAASHQRDDPALLVPSAVVMAAAAGAAVLADAADHHLGFPADLHRPECRVFRARRRHADRCRDPVGHPVPRPARLFDLVSGGDVVALSLQPDDEPPHTHRVS